MSNEIEELQKELETLKTLHWLAASDAVFFGHYDELDDQYHTDATYPYLLCNDTFGYACADAESIWPEDYKKVKQIYEKYGYSGIVAMVSIKRNIEPIQEWQDEEYKKALEEINRNSELKLSTPNIKKYPFDNAHDAYWWIMRHKNFRGIEYVSPWIDISPHKVNPETKTVEDDTSLNTEVEWWIEGGGHTLDDGQMVSCHDWDLDTGGSTPEEAIINFAKKVYEKYEG